MAIDSCTLGNFIILIPFHEILAQNHFSSLPFVPFVPYSRTVGYIRYAPGCPFWTANEARVLIEAFESVILDTTR